MKKKLCSLVLAGLSACGMFGLSACGEEEKPTPTGGISFTSVYSSTDTFSLNPGEEKKFSINKDITGKNYMRLIMNSTNNLYGTFEYCDVSDPTRIVEENFFIEPSNKQIEFKQFLDSYRANGVGLFDKKMLSVTLKNVDNETATVKLGDFAVADRDVPAFEKEIYIESGDLKVGADLAMGGTLSYLERTNYAGAKIAEYIGLDGNVTISLGVDAESGISKEFLSNSVNLINIHDAGREIQQSYYAAVGGTEQEATGANGYQRYTSFTADPNGYYWPYNPVQGGDEACNVSQIIDYQVTSNQIYVKTRAMDWANGYGKDEYKLKPSYNDLYNERKDGRTTKSYIENWYEIKDNKLFVTNRFIDWNGFTDMDEIRGHNLEIPATYIVHPLNKYVCYEGNNAWDLDDVNYVEKPNLGFWTSAATSYRSTKHPEDWFAWVNEQNFGVGIYVPGAGNYVSGRVETSREAEDSDNAGAYHSKMGKADEFLYNKKAPTSKYTSCYVSNTSYTAPVVTVKMKEYVALSYRYVVAVDFVENFRAEFKQLHDTKAIDNSTLKAWDY